MICHNHSVSDAEHRDPEKTARPLAIDLGSVAQIRVIPSRIRGLTHKTLLIDFARPLPVLSTLAGFKAQIGSIGNHYLPPASWGGYDEAGLAGLHARTCRVLERPEQSTGLLFTGVDVGYLSLQRRQYRETVVYALVTAGVKSNAAHMVKDRGEYYEPGTINIILLSNRTLCSRAMTQALIVATEAKTAALHDLDIRSSDSPLRHAATGTGTDGVLVAQGAGTPIDYAGGHTKVGELIAKAVYSGVLEAIAQWEGLTSGRSILKRLHERHLSLTDMFDDRFDSRCELSTALEELLREPRYAGFLATALSVSDDYDAGLIGDLGAFEFWCRQLAEEIAGEKIVPPMDLFEADGLLPMALNSLANGLSIRMKKQNAS